MALNVSSSVDIIEIMENYLERERPPVEVRNQLDIGYEIKDQSIILQEIRPVWGRPDEIMRNGYAKATYVKSKDLWKVYWLRGNLKWYPYDVQPTVKKLTDFLELVDVDSYGCFKG